MNTVTLAYSDLLIASALLLFHGLLSIIYQLGLVRTLAIAAFRMVVQLSLVGLVLKFLFSTQSIWLTGFAALVMIGFGGYEAMARQKRKLRGLWGYGIGTSAMLFASALVTIFALVSQIQADPWYSARYALPLLGMILGNCMNGVALGLDRLLNGAYEQRRAIEAMLALGYRKQDAFRPLVREAVRMGLIPIINSMAATGLVSLPGMMTGQILAGVEPMEAVKYQMLVMFLIAGGTAIGVTIAVTMGATRLSDSRHRLRLERLKLKQ